MNLENYIKQYFIQHKIPLKTQSNISTIKMCILGANKAGCGGNTVTRFAKKYFPKKPPYVKLYTYILSLNNMKYCTDCNNIMDVGAFGTNISKRDGKNNLCKSCVNIRTSKYKKQNPELSRFSTRKYQTAKLNRTPKWANLEKIKEFYLNCPEGYHVDHIIPLQGKNISGLHIETNLQYLLATKNLEKGNKWSENFK